jgi:hypothetical protein
MKRPTHTITNEIKSGDGAEIIEAIKLFANTHKVSLRNVEVDLCWTDYEEAHMEMSATKPYTDEEWELAKRRANSARAAEERVARLTKEAQRKKREKAKLLKGKEALLKIISDLE